MDERFVDHAHIVAELGINHNGDIKIAKQLIDAAKFAGANAVKFQKRNINKVYSKEFLDSPRESPWGNTQRAQKVGLEFDKKEYDVIDEYCKKVDIEWFASPWDLDSLEFLCQYKSIIHMKLASPMLVHIPLIIAIAKTKKYTFISTGGATVKEIQTVVDIFKKNGCGFELMHCNSQYPMPVHVANLKCIETLRNMFNCKVGYSCHSPGIILPVAARVLGATSIEKHITLDRSMYGSDQASSIESTGFYRMVQYIRAVEEALKGGGKKIVTEEELKIMKKLRKTSDFNG